MVQIEPSTTHHRSKNYNRHTRHIVYQCYFHKFEWFWGHLHTVEAVCDNHLEAVPGVHFEAATPIHIKDRDCSSTRTASSSPKNRRSQEYNG